MRWRHSAPNLVIADYDLPGFDGLAAVKLIASVTLSYRSYWLLAGKMGEEAAAAIINTKSRRD